MKNEIPLHKGVIVHIYTIRLEQWWATIFAQGPLMQKFSFLRAAPLFLVNTKSKKFHSKYIVRHKFSGLSLYIWITSLQQHRN